MAISYIFALFLNFLINILLMLSASNICCLPTPRYRILLASALNCLLLGILLLPEVRSAGIQGGNIVAAAISAVAAFCGGSGWIRKATVYVLIQLSLAAVAAGVDKEGIWLVLFAACCLFAVYKLSVKIERGGGLIDVEINYLDKKVKLKALQDTGNFLTDPVTGASVLVVGADIAHTLVGLSKHQLSNPIESVEQGIFPGLRLIPFKTVGQSNGLLLALKFQNVKIGHKQGSRLIAFAPDGLTGECGYQALTGGTI